LHSLLSPLSSATLQFLFVHTGLYCAGSSPSVASATVRKYCIAAAF
jgi:hypothetical protein